MLLHPSYSLAADIYDLHEVYSEQFCFKFEGVMMVEKHHIHHIGSQHQKKIIQVYV